MIIDIAYEPTERQRKFHESGSDEVLYGGAAGDGQHEAGRVCVLPDVLHRGILH